MKMKLEHEGKIEKEKQLFFLSDISVYLSYSLIYINDIWMILNQIAINCLGHYQESEEGDMKK